MKLQKAILIVSFLIFFLNLKAQNIVINEIITSNSSVNTDDDESYEDWVELYNTGTENINLLGYGLSDNDNLFKWVFPDYSIQPGEHLLIWCSNKNRTNPEFPLHTNFAISAGGETITLTFPDGTIADQIPPVVINQNYSYGRATDGNSEFIIFPIPTPGLTNFYQEGTTTLSPPLFSVESGFYSNEFTLNITHPDPDVTIIYTTDGSVPDETNITGTAYQYKNIYPQNPGDGFGVLFNQSYTSHNYINPLVISDRTPEDNKISSISTTNSSNPTFLPEFPVLKSNVIRAKAIKDNAVSEIITKNYFYTAEDANIFTLPVIALNVNDDLLFDYEQGINVAGKDYDDWRIQNPNLITSFYNANFERSGDEWEVNAQFSYYVNQEEVLNQGVGIRIHGGQTRKYPSKSLRIYARSELGEESLDYPFFEDLADESFKRLILRNSGNDFATTYFLDAFIHKSVNHLNFETQAYQPTITFLNGEFWGILNMRERYDKHYFKRVFDINDGEIDHVEISGLYEAKEGDLDHYFSMLNFVETNSLVTDENFNYITTQLDPENFTDYHITEIYVNNLDWMHNNVELFRKKTLQYTPDSPYGHDGRWRWILKDTDVGFGLAGSHQDNTLAFAKGSITSNNPYPAWSRTLFVKMLENESFKNYFINRFADLLNTTFLPSRLEPLFYEMKNNISEEFPKHNERWNIFENIQTWHDYSSAIINYASQRPTYQRNHIREEFGITENINTYLYVSNPDHGYIKINTIEILPTTPGVQENPYPWLGIYFKDIPITLKAIAKPGYVFSHWTGASVSPESEITVIPNANIQLTAHFIPSEETAEEAPIYFWVMNNSVPNDTALTQINASFEVPAEGLLRFESCLEGYPFDSSHPNWRKASMERRNSPTILNYIPEANDDVPFESANMRGLQIKQPFQQNGLENQLIFEFSSFGYKDILFGFAAKDENAADAILIDYSISENTPIWTTNGLTSTSLNLSDEYQLYEVDFSSIEAVNNNPNLKIRLRFEGENMTQDNGDRVTFNNFSVKGTPETFGIGDPILGLQFTIYPNPVSEELYIVHGYNEVDYKLFSVDGKLVQNGILNGLKINVSNLQKGLYILQLEVDGKKETKKIVKK